jgi:SAM-dependent methyltransferase
MERWHDDDAFWAVFEPWMFTPERMAAASQEVDFVVERLGIEPGARVLDLCCGPGRHSLELARRGFRVTGVDRTARYLERGRRVVQEEGLDIEFVQADMREFRRPEAFDAATNLFSAFGYFADPADDRRVVENLHASLRPGGKLLMDLMGKERLARIFRERDWHPIEGGFFLEERKLSQAWSWIDTRWILVRDGETTEFTVSHRLYSAAELVSLLRECGFADCEVYGNLAGRPYDQDAERLVVLGTARESEGQ